MFLVLFVLILGFVSADDQINKLPGLKFDIGFKHYSGYLKASDTHFLHYWFVESQGNPSHDPLVFWFNGGPGCSSLDGLLNEMGPYQINPDGKTLRKNENAWNQIASIVYIEAPAGVGYSYSTDGNITTDDDQTSTENYAAIRTFFDRYPRFRNHSVFVTGESYGGVYIPTLTGRIIDGQTQFPINLKGLAIGNGYMNAKLNIDTSVRFAYGHGILDQKTWDTIEKECCRGCIDGCDLTAVTGHCASMVEEVFNFLWAGGLNVYDLYRDCDPNPERNSIRLTSMLQGLGHKNVSSTGYFGSKWMGSLGQGLTSDAPCLNDSDAITYMNNVDVRTALNIPFNLDRWDICSDKVTSTYKKKYDDMTPFIKKALAENIRILLYYGDTDMACNFMLGQQFAASLGLKRMIGKQPWKYGKQIAGFKGLTFTTIRGAGHMAPQWRAPEMRYAFGQFLLNHPI